MSKTKEELDELKSEAEALSKKLSELSEDELSAVAGGAFPGTLVFRGEQPDMDDLVSRPDNGAVVTFLDKGAPKKATLKRAKGTRKI
ncbi:MAG: hypothetical protein Q4F31_10525 [Eubacteriales bacterium]|nr:hypothetical protein [Eubacteriales bacterium]